MEYNYLPYSITADHAILVTKKEKQLLDFLKKNLPEEIYNEYAQIAYRLGGVKNIVKLFLNEEGKIINSYIFNAYFGFLKGMNPAIHSKKINAIYKKYNYQDAHKLWVPHEKKFITLLNQCYQSYPSDIENKKTMDRYIIAHERYLEDLKKEIQEEKKSIKEKEIIGELNKIISNNQENEIIFSHQDELFLEKIKILEVNEENKIVNKKNPKVIFPGNQKNNLNINSPENENNDSIEKLLVMNKNLFITVQKYKIIKDSLDILMNKNGDDLKRDEILYQSRIYLMNNKKALTQRKDGALKNFVKKLGIFGNLLISIIDSYPLSQKIFGTHDTRSGKFLHEIMKSKIGKSLN